MTTWTSEQLTRIGSAEELRVASLRSDHTLRKPRTVWVVRHDDDIYIRSVNGPDAAWYRGTRTRHEGHVSAGGVDTDVTFVDVGHDVDDAVDEAYRRKYRRYAANIIDAINGSQAQTTTLRLIPR